LRKDRVLLSTYNEDKAQPCLMTSENFLLSSKLENLLKPLPSFKLEMLAFVADQRVTSYDAQACQKKLVNVLSRITC